MEMHDISKPVYFLCTANLVACTLCIVNQISLAPEMMNALSFVLYLSSIQHKTLVVEKRLIWQCSQPKFYPLTYFILANFLRKAPKSVSVFFTWVAVH